MRDLSDWRNFPPQDLRVAEIPVMDSTDVLGHVSPQKAVELLRDAARRIEETTNAIPNSSVKIVNYEGEYFDIVAVVSQPETMVEKGMRLLYELDWELDHTENRLKHCKLGKNPDSKLAQTQASVVKALREQRLALQAEVEAEIQLEAARNRETP